MVLNYKKLFYIFAMFLTFSLFAEEKNISIFYEKNEALSDDDFYSIMYIFNCIESENRISDCNFFCDYNFASIPVERRVLLNKNDAFYIVYFEAKKMRFDIYDKSGEIISSSEFDFTSCSSLDDLNIIKEKIYEQIEKDVLHISHKEAVQIINENRMNFNEKKINHDFPYASLSVTGVSFHLYYEDLNNFSIFPINFSVSFYPLRYMEINLFYDLSYNDFYLDCSSGSLALFSQFYGMSLGFSFFYKAAHYSFGASFYNISAFVENSGKLRDVVPYFLPQFAFYQRLDIKLYKMIYYTMYVSFHTVQKFSNEGSTWNGKRFDYDLPQLDVSLLGISLFF